jgi:predicted MFS family arabinose efflux permease
MLLAATQDIATDGLAVRALGYRQRGPGNGIQVGGYYLGQILGGGAMLLIFGRFGWTVAILAMAVFLALPIGPALRYREPQRNRELSVDRVDYHSILRFFGRAGAGAWVPILLLFRAPEAMALTMLTPMLVDRGHSLEEIGLLIGVVGSLASLTGALVGGLWLTRLGRKRSLLVFGLLQAMAIGSLALLASESAPSPAVYSVIVSLSVAGGMATTALYTSMMDRSSARAPATDFTLQQSLAAIGPIVGAGLSGFSAARFGYSGHFVAAYGVSIGCLMLVAWGLTVEQVDAAAAADL